MEIHGAIHAGRFTDREADCFAWTLGGLRGFRIHELYTKWRHSMYELARTVTVLWSGNHPLSRWLNLWGDNPHRPLPEPDGLTPMERARHRGYPWPTDPLGKDMAILPHDPWVRELEAHGMDPEAARVAARYPGTGHSWTQKNKTSSTAAVCVHAQNLPARPHKFGRSWRSKSLILRSAGNGNAP